MYYLFILLLASSAACFSFNSSDVTFFLTTPEEPGTRHSFSKNNYKNLTFKQDRKYKVICHGWKGSVDDQWYANLTKEYMDKGDVNVIAVSYHKLVSSLIYYPAPWKAPDIGNEVSDLILDLYNTKNISLDKIHIIGHSLGAHVAARTGYNILMTTGSRIDRITGLDPALPGFIFASANNKLTKDDASFVDVIHTSTYGNSLEMGHVDFYPNGGLEQSGCNMNPGCSHYMAILFFILSIPENRFKACNSYFQYQLDICDDTDTAFMGEGVQLNKRGSYYLNTDSSTHDNFQYTFSSIPLAAPWY